MIAERTPRNKTQSRSANAALRRSANEEKAKKRWERIQEHGSEKPPPPGLRLEAIALR